MQPGTLYGLGIGPGDPELITVKAVRLIKSCDVIFTVISSHADASTSETLVRSYKPEGRIERLVFTMSRIQAEREEQVRRNAGCIIGELQQGHNCAFATLGDTLSYSTFGYILPLVKKALPEVRVEIIPGVTSWSTLAARAGRVLVENKECLRVIPSFTKDIAEKLVFEPDTATILLKTYKSRSALTARLRQEDVDVVYGENLTQPDEFVTDNLDEIDARKENYLSLMLVRRKKGSL